MTQRASSRATAKPDFCERRPSSLWSAGQLARPVALQPDKEQRSACEIARASGAEQPSKFALKLSLGRPSYSPRKDTSPTSSVSGVFMCTSYASLAQRAATVRSATVARLVAGIRSTPSLTATSSAPFCLLWVDRRSWRSRDG